MAWLRTAGYCGVLLTCAGLAFAQDIAALRGIEPTEVSVLPDSLSEQIDSSNAASRGDRGATDDTCNGDITTGTPTMYTASYPLNGAYNNSRSTALVLRSEFPSCTPGTITQIAVSVYTASSTPEFTNIQIKMQKTTATSVTTAWDGGGAIVWSGSATFVSTGWKTFELATPFDWDADNLLITWEWSGTLSGTYPTFLATGPLPVYCQSYNRWNGVTPPPAELRSYFRVYYRLTFAAPAQGACCTVGGCVPNLSAADCAAYPGFYVGNGIDCAPEPCTGACCYGYPSACVTTDPATCVAAYAGTYHPRTDCDTFFCPPWNDDCWRVTPVDLLPGMPQVFSGDTRGATNDPGECTYQFPQVWHAITLPGPANSWTVVLDFCPTTPPFTNAFLNWTVGCPCVNVTPAGTYNFTSCGSGPANATITWTGLAAGTYYYPVLSNPGQAYGPYTIDVVANPAYCISGATFATDENIQEFVCPAAGGGIEQHNPAVGWCDSYNDFTAASTNLSQNTAVPFSLTIGDCEGGGCYSKWAAIYIDWDQNYSFGDAGELVWSSGLLGSTPCPNVSLTGAIAVPSDAPLGATRMRVLVIEGATAPPPPCGTYSWGATEDFTVNVVLPPPTGACCLGDFICAGPMTEPECLALNPPGTYRGDGSTCTPNPCRGACCLSDGSCDDRGDLGYCLGLAGAYGGDGTNCVPNLCPPANDDCSGAILLVLPAIVVGDSSAATDDVPPPTRCDASQRTPYQAVWYRVVGTGNTITASLCDGATWNTIIDVYCGDCENPVCVGGDDDGCGGALQSRFAWCAERDRVYYVLVAAYSPADGGAFTLSLSDDGVPCLDPACAPPGACCYWDGACQESNEVTCIYSGGTAWHVGNTCSPNLCPQPAPQLTLEMTSSACRHLGDEIVVEVWMHDIVAHIVGGQFFLQYDASKLALASPPDPNDAVAPGTAPMSVEIFECSLAHQSNAQCSPAVGLLDYAVGVPAPPGTDFVTHDHKLAVLRFVAIGEICETAGLVSFRAENDPPTRLSDACGNAVVAPLVNLPALTIDDTPPTIVGCPAEIAQIADPGVCSAVVTWTAPSVYDNCVGATIVRTTGPAPSSVFPVGSTAIQYTATDACGLVSHCHFPVIVSDTEPPVAHCPSDITVYADPGDCTKVVTWDSYATDNCPQATIACSPPSGSVFSGITTVTCTATDAAGNQSTCTFTVTVLQTNVLQVAVDLCPTVGVSVERCITFDLWKCPDIHATVEAELQFVHGHASATLLVPCVAGTWDCVTARDRLHTLCRTAVPTPLGDHYVVSFESPNCLDGGNLNDDRYVDLLDFGVLMSQWSYNYGTGNTTCSPPPSGANADINGDGIVQLADFTFIQINFRKESDPGCCGPLESRDDGPVTRISIAELAARGWSRLAVADLNHDGWLDEADIVAFLNGARPQAATAGDARSARPVKPAEDVER